MVADSTPERLDLFPRMGKRRSEPIEGQSHEINSLFQLPWLLTTTWGKVPAGQPSLCPGTLCVLLEAVPKSTEFSQHGTEKKIGILTARTCCVILDKSLSLQLQLSRGQVRRSYHLPLNVLTRLFYCFGLWRGEKVAR